MDALGQADDGFHSGIIQLKGFDLVGKSKTMNGGAGHAKFQLSIANGSGAITRKPSTGGSSPSRPASDKGFMKSKLL